MADKDLTISIKTTGDPKGAQTVEHAIESLESEAKSATTSVAKLADAKQKLSSAATAATGSSKNLGGAFNAVSIQAGDFTTQLVSGTSATRAFAMQAPQLIGQLSMMGMITGPVGIGLMAISAAIPLISMAVEKLTSASGALDLVTDPEKAGKFVEGINKAREASEKMKALADAAVQTWTMLREAKADAALAGLDNEKTSLEIQREINQQLGIEISLEKELLAIEKGKRAAEAMEKKAAAVATAVKARDSAMDKLGEVRRIESELRDAKIQLYEQRGKFGRHGTPMWEGGPVEKLSKEELNELAQLIANAKALVEDREKKLRESAAELAVLETKAEDAAAAASKTVESINEKLDLENTRAEAKAALETLGENERKLSETLGQIRPKTAALSTAVESIKADLESGGKITEEELPRVVANTKTLMTGVRNGLVEADATQKEILGVMNSFITSHAATIHELKLIKDRLKAVETRAR